MPSTSPQPQEAQPDAATTPTNYAHVPGYYPYPIPPQGAGGSPGDSQGSPNGPVPMMAYGPPPPGVQYWPPPGYMAIPVPMHMAVGQGAGGMSNNGKAKRRQVKNACTNCQTACKRCEDTRPCQRCVKYGLSDTCVNSARKERKKGIKRGPYKKRKADGAEEQDPAAMEGMEAMGMPPPGAPYHPGGYPHAEGQYYSFYPGYAFQSGGAHGQLVPVPPDGANGATDEEEGDDSQGGDAVVHPNHYYQQIPYAQYFHPAPPTMAPPEKKEEEDEEAAPPPPVKRGRKKADAGEGKEGGRGRGRKRKAVVQEAVPVDDLDELKDNDDIEV